MNVGDIFRWTNFPCPKHGNIKSRWFIYLGNSGIYNTTIYIHILTTTTNLSNITGSCISFKKGECGFESDCVANIDNDFYNNLTNETIEKNKNDIEIIGAIPENKLKYIYKKVLESKRISKIVKMDIYNSFNLNNITGLKKP